MPEPWAYDAAGSLRRCAPWVFIGVALIGAWIAPMPLWSWLGATVAPLALLTGRARHFKDAGGWLRVAGPLVAVALAVSVLTTVAGALGRSSAHDVATLRSSAPVLSLNVGDHHDAFELEARGILPADTYGSKGSFQLRLQRGSAIQVIERQLEVIAQEHEDFARELVLLPGPGAVELTLENTNGALAPRLDVSLRPVTVFERSLRLALPILVGAAAMVDGFANRQGFRSHIFAAAAACVALSVYLRDHAGSDVTLAFVNACVAAAVAGGLAELGSRLFAMRRRHSQR